ncbi:MAG: transketolase C-terminal domain-containing protein, partial [Candidatus Acidiferrales bacterium]
IRTSRPKTPLLYSATDKFPVPGFHVLRESANDRALIVGGGITVHEALKAHEELKSRGISARVMDLYCVKPIDGKQVAEQLKAAGGNLITVEDHYPEGGLGEAVLSALAEAGTVPKKYVKLAVIGMPHSGKPDELLEAFGISAKHIVGAIHAINCVRS